MQGVQALIQQRVIRQALESDRPFRIPAILRVVGVVAKWCLPELPWDVCFVLGAIVSPTDTVAGRLIRSAAHRPVNSVCRSTKQSLLPNGSSM
jgi:hypothetical protein